VHERDGNGSRIHAVHGGIHGTGGRRDRRIGKENGLGNPQSDLLAFLVPPVLQGSRFLHHRRGIKGVCHPLGALLDGKPSRIENGDHRKEGPSLAGTPDHPSEEKGQGKGEQGHLKGFEGVRKRGRIFEGVGRIGVVVPPPVCPDVLDRLQGGDRTQDQRLAGPLKRVDNSRRPEGLGRALCNVNERHQKTGRQEGANEEADEVRPEISESSAGLPGEAAKDGYKGGHSRVCPDEHEKGDREHLGEDRQLGLSRIGLPVGVGDEGGRRVEGQLRRKRRKVARVQRKNVLEPEHKIAGSKEKAVGGKKCQGVLLPAHLPAGVDPQKPVDSPLDPKVPAGIDPGQIAARKRRQADDESQDKKNLDSVVFCHFKASPH